MRTPNQKTIVDVLCYVDSFVERQQSFPTRFPAHCLYIPDEYNGPKHKLFPINRTWRYHLSSHILVHHLPNFIIPMAITQSRIKRSQSSFPRTRLVWLLQMSLSDCPPVLENERTIRYLEFPVWMPRIRSSKQLVSMAYVDRASLFFLFENEILFFSSNYFKMGAFHAEDLCKSVCSWKSIRTSISHRDRLALKRRWKSLPL